MKRTAFTLIEILISLVITLVMMYAVVSLFAVVTDSVSGSRAMLETADRLRACRNRLALDLQGATVTPIPPRRPDNGEGYLEIVEGVQNDASFGGLTTANVSYASLFGDCDDAILLTTRSRGEPFIGKANGSVQDSLSAEVCYFMVNNGQTIGLDSANSPVKLYTLYRRCMLVVPDTTPLGSDVTPAFYDLFDVTARIAGSTRAANLVGDLTKPENRFSRKGTTWPTSAQFQTPVPFAANRLGDDVILTNVLAFDVQVYDPGAPMIVSSGRMLEPRDPGYTLSGYTPSVTDLFGAFADLGYGVAAGYSPTIADIPEPQFAGVPNAKSGYTATRPFVYDSWSYHYELDGETQNGNTDSGANGLDDDMDGLVDESDEFDTQPPYPHSLRGLRITIRVYEPGTQQIRQVSIVHDFANVISATVD